MKFLVSIILSLTLLLNSFSSVFVYWNFKVNQNEIAQTLCIKKEIKENTCQGKCHLAKQLKKVSDNKDEPTSNSKEKTEIVYIDSTQEYIINSLFLDVNKKSFLFYNCIKTTSFIVGVFHPPTA